MTTVTPATHRPMRADAVRNRQRIIESAAAALAECGPDVALEEIAGRAGVGIGTLYRHFPDRNALLAAVYRDRFDALSALGDELAGAADPGAALRQFLAANLDFSNSDRALAADVIRAALDELALDRPAAGLPNDSPCHTLRERGADLLARAQRAGAIRGDVTIDELMRLVGGIALATEGCGRDPGQSQRLLGLVCDGLQAGCAPPPGGSAT